MSVQPLHVNEITESWGVRWECRRPGPRGGRQLEVFGSRDEADAFLRGYIFGLEEQGRRDWFSVPRHADRSIGRAWALGLTAGRADAH